MKFNECGVCVIETLSIMFINPEHQQIAQRLTVHCLLFYHWADQLLYYRILSIKVLTKGS